jgi:hypothetical protein
LLLALYGEDDIVIVLHAWCNMTGTAPSSAETSLSIGEAGPVLFNIGTASGIFLRSWLAVRPASCFVDLGKRLCFFPLLLHRFACRRIWWAIGVRNGI